MKERKLSAKPRARGKVVEVEGKGPETEEFGVCDIQVVLFLFIPYTVVLNILTRYLLCEYFPGRDSHTTDSLHLFLYAVSGIFHLPSLNCLPFRISALPPFKPHLLYLFLKVTIKNFLCSYRRKDTI